MTGRELITASLRLIGVIASGESLEASEATDGLETLNQLLGSWSNEGLMINAVVREEFALTPSDGSYTMGTGANFSTTRPIEIERAAIENQSSTPMIEYPVHICTPEEWAEITDKDTTSEIPTHVYAEGTYPNETINLYPVPTVAHKLVLYSKKELTAIATLDTEISMPPGYDRALKFNLAIDLAPEYGKSVSAEVGMAAQESKAAIKSKNIKPRFLKCDAAITGGGSFDITRGE